MFLLLVIEYCIIRQKGGGTMRLSEIYHICSFVLENWAAPSFVAHTAPGREQYYLLENGSMIKVLLIELRSVPSLTEDVESILSSPVMLRSSPKDMPLTSTERSQLSVDLGDIRDRLVTITQLYKDMGLVTSEETLGFDIKLPPGITLDGISKCTHDLDTILNGCPLLRDCESTVTFTRTDVGSVWFSFAVTGTLVTAFLSGLAHLIDKAIILRSHWLSVRQQEAQARQLGLAEDVAKSMADAFAAVNSKLLEQAVQELSVEHDIKDPEAQERIRYSIATLSEWMDKGMEIYPSLNAPQDVQLVFPPIERQSLSAQELKMLTSPTQDESDTAN